MGDEFTCPDCDSPLEDPARCVCGWGMDKKEKMKDNGEKFCMAKSPSGEWCNNPPVQTVESKWFCREHTKQKLGYVEKRTEPKLVSKHLAEIYTILGKPNKAKEVLERGVA